MIGTSGWKGCGGKLLRKPLEIHNDKTGQVRKVHVLRCCRCGDSPFRPEQATAQKHHWTCLRPHKRRY